MIPLTGVFCWILDQRPIRIVHGTQSTSSVLSRWSARQLALGNKVRHSETDLGLGLLTVPTHSWTKTTPTQTPGSGFCHGPQWNHPPSLIDSAVRLGGEHHSRLLSFIHICTPWEIHHRQSLNVQEGTENSTHWDSNRHFSPESCVVICGLMPQVNVSKLLASQQWINPHRYMRLNEAKSKGKESASAGSKGPAPGGDLLISEKAEQGPGKRDWKVPLQSTHSAAFINS